MRKLKKRGKRESGQAAVEFAILLPVLLILICGILDFGWMFYCRLTLSNATRECARFAALHCYEYSEDDLQDVLETKAEQETRGIFKEGVDVDAQIVGDDYSVKCYTTMKTLTVVLSTINGSRDMALDDEFTMRIESIPPAGA